MASLARQVSTSILSVTRVDFAPRWATPGKQPGREHHQRSCLPYNAVQQPIWLEAVGSDLVKIRLWSSIYCYDSGLNKMEGIASTFVKYGKLALGRELETGHHPKASCKEEAFERILLARIVSVDYFLY